MPRPTAGPDPPRRRSSAAIALVALGAVACGPGADPAPTVVATPTCDPDVAVVAVRGSTEPPGLGGPAGVVARAVDEALATRTVAVREVDYPATLAGYEASVDAGVAATLDALRSAAAACVDTRLVVVGYSQGAQVVGRALREVDEDVRARVAATVLVADPTRAADDDGAVLHRGDPAAGPGGDGLLGPRPVPAALTGRVLHWCNPADAVCDATACEGPVLGCLLAGTGLAAHGDYTRRDVGPVTAFVVDAVG